MSTETYAHDADEAAKNRNADGRGQRNPSYEEPKDSSRDELGDSLRSYILEKRGGSRGATSLNDTIGFALDWAQMNADMVKKMDSGKRGSARRRKHDQETDED